MENKIVDFVELMQLVKKGKAPDKIRVVGALTDSYVFYYNEINDRVSNCYKNGCDITWDNVIILTPFTSFEILDENFNFFQEIDKIDFQTVESQKEKNRLIKDTINQLIKNQERIIKKLKELEDGSKKNV